MKFRKDINGLRAIAVISVILFHFGILGAQSGYIGVDIFFVISGFLMTGIISRRLENGRFSLWEFYIDRGRRIVPALVFLCIVLLGIGWFILTPENYRVLGKHAVASLTFISNFIFWFEANYFAQASKKSGYYILGLCRWNGSFICFILLSLFFLKNWLINIM